MVSISLLAVASIGALQLRANGVSQTDLILTQSESADGQKVLAKHYSSVLATLTTVIVSEKKLNDVLTRLGTIDTIEQATVYTGDDGRPDVAAPAKVVDGRALINVTRRAD
jgi:RND superfamily putative drug exporter